MHARIVIIMALVIAGGCAPKSYQPSPKAEFRRSNDEITRNRALKRMLIKTHPYEMAVQAALDKDPRIESARFTLPVMGWDHIDLGIRYDLVLTTKKPVTKDVAVEIILSAFAASDIRVNENPKLIQFGDSWSTVYWGNICFITKDEIPDMSTIQSKN